MQNAVKFSQKGGLVKVTVSFHPLKFRQIRQGQARGNPREKFCFIVTEIEDSGNGIKKDQINSLFQMFNGGSRNSNRTKGVGLGLSTARSLSHALQGAISLQTKEGVGTKVTFSSIALYEEE